MQTTRSQGASREKVQSYEYDKGWDDYNKMMREMRHRVNTGVKKRKKGQQEARLGKFSPSASGTRRGTLALTSQAMDEE